MQPKPDYAAGAAYHEQRRHLHAHAVRCLELAMVTFAAPRSVLDVGCGEGALVGWCRTRGIEAIGLDLAVPVDEPGWGLLHHDLRMPLDLGIAFEWVLCWEVGEHLPADAAGTLCDTLARHVARPFGRLLFTAAVPGQRGPGHINTQPLWFWRALLEERGLHWQAEETSLLAPLWLSEAPKAPWYGNNLQCFAWA
jgi:hypothetical protein